MQTIAIIGAGDLAATLARRIAEAELSRRVVLVDADEGRARGKALDITQSGPVEAYDTRVEAAPDLKAAGTAEVVVIADPEELADSVLLPTRGAALIERLVPAIGRGTLLVAGAQPEPLVEAAGEKGLSRDRVLGSAPVAWAAAVRRRLADELGIGVREVALTVLGLPPRLAVLSQGSATVGGIPAERLSPIAVRRALAAVQERRLGPVALAAAALRVLSALDGSRPSVLTVVARLDGEYGQRRVALAVPARLRAGRIDGILEVPLDPIDRVTFDNAAHRRATGG